VSAAFMRNAQAARLPLQALRQAERLPYNACYADTAFEISTQIIRNSDIILLLLPDRAGAADMFYNVGRVAGVSDLPRAGDGNL
jgi:hypothetical protein